MAIVQKMKKAVIGTKDNHGNELGVSLGCLTESRGMSRSAQRDSIDILHHSVALGLSAFDF